MHDTLWRRSWKFFNSNIHEINFLTVLISESLAHVPQKKTSSRNSVHPKVLCGLLSMWLLLHASLLAMNHDNNTDVLLK